VANILATVISEMLNEGLAGLLGAESKLILSGILEEQVDDLLAIARGAGLDLIESRQQEDWVALLLKKQPAPQGGAGFN
jgi:ribosomal protein L11 methylase PrmA